MTGKKRRWSAKQRLQKGESWSKFAVMGLLLSQRWKRDQACASRCTLSRQ